MAATTRHRAPVTLHGTIPPPGVWSDEGHGVRKRVFNLGDDLVPLHSAQDFVSNNSFFSNGAGDGQAKAFAQAREISLDHVLKPPPPPATITSDTGAASSPLQSSHGGAPPAAFPGALAASSPVRRISAVRLQDASSLGPTPGASASPQRVFVDGAWRLNLGAPAPAASMGSPDMSGSWAFRGAAPDASSGALGGRAPALQQSYGGGSGGGTPASSSTLALSASRASLLVEEGKRFVTHESERQFQLDNIALAASRGSAKALERQRSIDSDREMLDDWTARWGYPDRRFSLQDSPSRRRLDPTVTQPTLVGFQLATATNGS